MITSLYVLPTGRACRYRADFPYWMHAKEKKTKGPSRLKNRHDLQVSTSNDVVHETYFDGVPRDLDDINDTLKAMIKSESTVVFAEDDPDYIQLTKMCDEEGVDGGIKAHAIFARSVKLMSSDGGYELKKKMAQHLFEIVEGNGEPVHATDDARVISSALFSWSFVATFFIERRDPSIFDCGTARHVLDTFVNLLRIESVQVTAAACQAIGLIYEARRLGTFPRIFQNLQPTQHDLAHRILGFLNGIVVNAFHGIETMGLDDLRLLANALRSLRRALVLNCGPVYYMTNGRPPFGPGVDYLNIWNSTIPGERIYELDQWRSAIRIEAAHKLAAVTGVDFQKWQDLWLKVSLE